jgi:hypothetical protein
MDNEMNLNLPETGTDAKKTIRFSGPVVLVGANGAGKSRMGRWIERNQVDPKLVHRISAQKNLRFPKDPVLLTLGEAEDLLFNGQKTFTKSYASSPEIKLDARWGFSPELAYYLNDIDGVVAYLFARKRVRDDEFVRASQSAASNGSNEILIPPDAPHDTLSRIWDKLLPSIAIAFKNDCITASRNTDYSAADMSDGERVIFYLLAQTILARPGTILLVDEPEIHIHKSIISALWNELEKARPDCLFVYMTQDLSFASSRIGGTVIWVKSYDGRVWDWEIVPASSPLPETLLLQIMGTTRTAIFTEGEAGSHDALIYSVLLPDATLLSRGSCHDVIIAVKAARDNRLLDGIDVRGIVDRDYRSDAEIAALRTSKIAVLEVAEVEHLYCLPEVVRAVGSHLGLTNQVIDDAIAKIGKYLIKEKAHQTFKRSVAKLREELGIFSAKGNQSADLQMALSDFLAKVNAQDRYRESEEVYTNAIASGNEREILKYFNRKGLYVDVGNALGIKREAYESVVLNLLRNDAALRAQVLAYLS